MDRHNPFFTLERRRRRSRWLPFHLAVWGASLSLVPVALALGVRAVGLPWDMRDAVPAMLLLLLTGGAIGAGSTAGRTVFTTEWREGMLDDLRLLPLPPRNWITLKLLAPLLMVLLLAGATLPVTLTAAVLEILPAEEALPAAGYALGLGLLWLGLFVPVDRTGSPERKLEVATAPEKFGFAKQWGLLGLVLPRALLGFAMPGVVFASGQSHLQGGVRFFAGRIPLSLILTLMVVAVALTAYGSVRHTLLETPSTLRGARVLAWAGFLVDWMLFTGVVWAFTQFRIVPALLLAIPFLSFVGGGPAERAANLRSTNPGVEMELGWLETRWPNPIFLHDLRRHLGRQSLRERIIRAPLAVVLLGLLALAAHWLLHWNPFRAPGTAGGPLLWVFLLPLLSLAGPANVRWMLERQRGDFYEKALTPISSRDWLLGRTTASVLAQICGVWTLWLLEGLALLWLGTTQFRGIVLPLFLLLALITLWAGTVGTFPGIRPYEPRLADLFYTDRYSTNAGYTALLVVAVVLLFAGAVWPSGWWVVGSLCLLCLGLALGAVRALFRLSVEELDLLRCGEAEWKQPLPGARK